MKASLDKFGRIVIPKKFRDDFGLEAGDSLEVEETGEGIYLRPESDQGELTVREGVLVYTAKANGSLEKELEAMRNSRLDKFGPSV